MKKFLFLSVFFLLFQGYFISNISCTSAFGASFSYETKGEEDIVKILEAFADWRRLTVSFSEGLSSGNGGTLTGTFNFDTSEEFLSFMGRNKKIASYSQTDGIFFCLRSEMESMLFNLQGTSIGVLRSRLRALGLYDQRYPLRTSGSSVFRVTAPKPYIDVLSQLVAEISIVKVDKKKATKVFKLKHAWARDITVAGLNEEVVVPGVATLLREITGSATKSQDVKRAITTVQRVGSVGEKKTPEAPAQVTNNNNNTNADSGGARILADARLNAVIIWDDADRMPFYEGLIKALDKPTPLVEIRVAIIDVSVNKARELGIAWSGSTNFNSGDWAMSGGINNTGDLTNVVGSGLNLTTVYTNGLDMLMARVSALEEIGDARTLSRPAVLTMDNVQASLENVSTFYIDVAGTEVADLFAIEYGTVLKVTPHIVDSPEGQDKLVKLVVHIESGSSSTDPTSESVKLPTVSRSIINTQAMVPENQALIVGGYYYERSEETESGIPVLMHIPVLGYAFKKDVEKKNVIERLFVLSPRIVDPRSMLERPPPHIASAISVSEQLQVPAIPPPAKPGGCSSTSTNSSKTTTRTFNHSLGVPIK